MTLQLSSRAMIAGAFALAIAATPAVTAVVVAGSATSVAECPPGSGMEAIAAERVIASSIGTTCDDCDLRYTAIADCANQLSPGFDNAGTF